MKNNRIIKFRAWDELNQQMVYEKFGSFFESYLPSHEILRRYENVMQFTGIHDKNGKYIYEGDILKTPSDDFCYVVFEDTGFAVKTYGSESIDWEFSTFYKDCEVIGNIYENPDLIKF